MVCEFMDLATRCVRFRDDAISLQGNILNLQYVLLLYFLYLLILNDYHTFIGNLP
jgi:hypothetical protein